MSYKIPFIKPSFPSSDKVAEDYAKIINSNWFTNFGPYEKEFSQKAADFLGNEVFAASVSNATLGLFIAIKTLFKSEGEKRQVLVPSFTFAAGPEMLILSNLTPVFIDIEKESWQPNWEQAEAYIVNNKDSLSGILLCNIFGVGNKSIAKWEDIAKKYKLPLIIDSAAGFGSIYDQNEKIGSRGDCEIFSLHATKPFAVGEGGFITSKNQQLIDSFKSFENFGFDKNKKIGVVGINAKLQEFNAAIGLRQLESFDERLVDRRASLEKYKQKLTLINGVFQENDDRSTVPFVSIALFSKEITDKVLNNLIQAGVEARKYYEPLHRQDLLAQQSILAGSLDFTNNLYDRIVSLPLHDSMSDEDIDLISNIILSTHEEYKS